MKVIFDLSSLHGENFDRVRRSALIDLVGRRQLTILQTPTFLEEILRGSLSTRFAERWRDVLRWALDVQPGGFFLDKLDIWHEELVVGAGPHARHTYPHSRSRRHLSHGELASKLRRVADTGEIANILDDASRAQVENDHQKKDAQKRLGQEIRESVAQQARRAGGVNRLGEVQFSQIRDRDVLMWGNKLASFLGPKHEARGRSLWALSPARAPFYRAFAEGISFWGYDVACQPRLRIDRNAQMDFEQLCYLNWADTVVSNETGFMNRAFEAIWRPRGKRLMTTDQFLNLVAALH